MQKVNITQAREKLPKIAEEVYFKGKSFLITKRGIPMAKIIKADGAVKTRTAKSKDIKKIAKDLGRIKGVWNTEWKDKSTVEVARLLRKRAWSSHAS